MHLLRQPVVTGTKGTEELNPPRQYVEGSMDLYACETGRFENSRPDNGAQSQCAPFDRYDRKYIRLKPSDSISLSRAIISSCFHNANILLCDIIVPQKRIKQ